MRLLRPRVLGWIVRLLVVVLVIAGVAAGTRTLRRSCQYLGDSDKFRFGWVMSVPCVPGYVVNAGEPRLYVAVTPQGRALEWDAIRRLFHDPEWREVFDARGCPLRGSGAGLTQRKLELKGGVLRVGVGESDGCTNSKNRRVNPNPPTSEAHAISAYPIPRSSAAFERATDLY